MYLKYTITMHFVMKNQQKTPLFINTCRNWLFSIDFQQFQVQDSNTKQCILHLPRWSNLMH